MCYVVSTYIYIHLLLNGQSDGEKKNVAQLMQLHSNNKSSLVIFSRDAKHIHFLILVRKLMTILNSNNIFIQHSTLNCCNNFSNNREIKLVK